MTSVTFPDELTSIGDYAFQYCSGLTSVTFPDGLTSIGGSAFSRCSGLTSVTFPDGLTSIGRAAFYGCSGLTSVTLPVGLTSIGSSAFSRCSGLTSVAFPVGLTSIGDYAFENCSGLTSVTFPDGLTSIGNSAFSGCSGLTTIFNKRVEPLDISSAVFSYSNPSTVDLYVPIGTLSAYETSSVWKKFNIHEGFPQTYTITAVSNNENFGSVQGGGVYVSDFVTQLKAINNQGYRFVSWHDGYTDNPRTITVTADATYTAIFEAKPAPQPVDTFYTITVVANPAEWGTVSGSGSYKKDTVITISATANSGYEFKHWSDENTDNPRTITVTADATYTAIFEKKNVVANENTTLAASKVYPNPNNGIFTLEVAEETQVEIFTVAGVKVQSRIYAAGKHRLKISASGVYILKLTVNGQSATRRVVVR